MPRYKYRAINAKGRPVKGVVSAVNEIDLHNQLQTVGLELVQCAALDKKKGALAALAFGKKIEIREIIQLFLHLEQMQRAGVSLLAALADIRDTTDNDALRDIMSEIHKDISEGNSLSEALAAHPKVFSNLHISLVSAGEETGDLTGAYLQLIKYLKWVDAMQAKIRKATRYPIIITVVVILTITIMMAVVVPQIVGFIRNLGQELPFYTTALINTSDFFIAYWWAVIIAPVIAFIALKVAREMSEGIAYQIDLIALNSPVFGPIIRKINIARFAQTFGALYTSGIDVLSGLDAAGRTVDNRAIADALDGIREKVHTGMSLSDAFNGSGEFPSMVVRMLKVGEESGNLAPVLEQVSEFYTSDVDEAVDGLISMIEPMLSGFLGIMILWIAVAVFGPIYASFENIDF